MAKQIVKAEAIMQALINAGILSDNDYDRRHVRRVIVDIQAGQMPVVHIERYGDARVLTLIERLGELEIIADPAPAGGAE